MKKSKKDLATTERRRGRGRSVILILDVTSLLNFRTITTTGPACNQFTFPQQAQSDERTHACTHAHAHTHMRTHTHTRAGVHIHPHPPTHTH